MSMNLREAREQLATSIEHLAEMNRRELTGRVSPRQREFVVERKRQAELVIKGESDSSPEASQRRSALIAAANAHREACRWLSPLRRALQSIESGADVDPEAFARDCERAVYAVRRLHEARLASRQTEVRA